MKSRIVRTAAERERTKRLLAEAYLKIRPVTGEVKVRSLTYSREPRDWSLTCTPVAGESYGEPIKHYNRFDMHLRVCLSPEWAVQRGEILCGAVALPAPAGVDHLELICTSDNPSASQTIQSCFYFVFTLGNFTARIPAGGHRCPSLRPGSLALSACNAEFRKQVAAWMAERLNPRKTPSTIDLARASGSQPIRNYYP